MTTTLDDLLTSYDDNSNEILEFLQQKEIECTAEQLMDMVMQDSQCENPFLFGKAMIRCNTIQTAICQNKSPEVIFQLLKFGGRCLIMNTDNDGHTPLHYACINENISADIILALIDVGGQDLVMKTDSDGCTPLHVACQNKNVSADIISALIDVGGQDLVMNTDNDGRTPLHYACQNKNVSADIISALIDVGGQDLVMKTDEYDRTPLLERINFECFVLDPLHHHCYIDKNNDAFIYIFKQSILANIGGEFGIGGLFNTGVKKKKKRTYNNIYKKWKRLAPALKSSIESLQEKEKPPILHAAILAKVYSYVIREIISDFKYSILKKDSLNRYPIEIAMNIGLDWNKGGLKEIVEATAVASQQQSSIIYVAAQYGLKWRNHMRELAEANTDEIINGCSERLFGLRVFMVAAMGEQNDLSSIYGMMRISPEMVKNNKE